MAQSERAGSTDCSGEPQAQPRCRDLRVQAPDLSERLGPFPGESPDSFRQPTLSPSSPRPRPVFSSWGLPSFPAERWEPISL